MFAVVVTRFLLKHSTYRLQMTGIFKVIKPRTVFLKEKHDAIFMTTHAQHDWST
jgi:hypothetical protein